MTLDLFSWTPRNEPPQSGSPPSNAPPPQRTPAIGSPPAMQGGSTPPCAIPPVPPQVCVAGVGGGDCGGGGPAGLRGPQPEAVAGVGPGCGHALRATDGDQGRTAAGGITPDCGGDPDPGTTSEQSALRPRPYQLAAIESVERQFALGARRTLVVLPTGTGKTIVLAALLARHKARQEGRRARGLVIAHRAELLQQNAAKCRAAGLTTSIEQGASRASTTSDVVVASVQTLRGARLLRFAPDAFDFVVIDEAHHAEAAGYQAIVAHFAGALVLGLTASPMRLDGKPLGNTFASVAYAYELRQAIRDEWLVPIIARRVRITDVDMSAIKAHHGDLAQDQLSLVLREAKALQGVVGPLVSLAGRRRTLVFAVDVAHAHALAEMLNKQRPGSALALDGDMPPAKRRAVLDLFRAGTFQYLVNCQVLTEGFDDAGIECVALARPTMSVALLIQMVGRGTRLLGLTYAESCANGKRDVLVLDFVGNLRHRLATPADALAGVKLPDDVAAEVNADLDCGKERDVTLVLAAAEKKAREDARRKAELALAHYRTTDVDPFVGEIVPPLDPDSPAARQPATQAQLDAIERWGLGRPPDGMSKGEASRILDGLAERQRRGLATVGQVKLLRKFKLDCTHMTKQRATELFLKGKARGFSGEWIYRDEPEYRPQWRKT